jgi:hypothetical protein
VEIAAQHYTLCKKKLKIIFTSALFYKVCTNVVQQTLLIPLSLSTLVVDNLFVVEGVAHWNVLFTRYAQDWEVEMVMSFYEQLYSIRIRYGEIDRVVWNLSKRRSFEVKTFYKALVCRGLFSLEGYLAC